MKTLLIFFRKYFYCRFGTHWRMKYDSGLPNDIGRAGTCTDCGYKAEEIKWPRMPKCKPPKTS